MNENEEIKTQRGRPRLKDGYGERLDVRISSAESSALEHMLIESNKNKSEIVRKALMTYYHLYQGKW